MTARILSAGIVLLHRSRDRYEYLLLRAFSYWDFPKGAVESGEKPLEAAIREVREETGITELNFRWGQQYRETKPYNHGRKIARYYIAETPGTEVQLVVNPVLGRPEHSEYRWVKRADAFAMLTPRVRAILVWADVVIRASSPV
jgi:8-oxo-dGTP pyrophosphatase MutT (NUDIX family)